MSRKLLTAIFITCLSLFCTKAMAQEVSWTDVSTADEFKTAVKKNANVRLTADIDLSSFAKEEDDMLFDEVTVFTGRITGKFINDKGNECAYSLKNCKYVMLPKMKNATIDNLIIANCHFDGWDTGSGQLAVEADGCHFTNVSLMNCTSSGDHNAYDSDQMGGLIGKAKNCYFTNVKALDTQLVTDGERAGLLVGEASDCHFDDCFTNLSSSIWADGNADNAYVGGFCGSATNCRFTRCANLALVCGNDDRVGGIVGYGTNTVISDCYNSGLVYHTDKAGFKTLKDRLDTAITTSIASGSTAAVAFIVGLSLKAYIETDVAISFSWQIATGVAFWASVAAVAVAVAAVTAAIIIYNCEPDELGGIAGTIEGGSQVRRCTNYGPIACYDAYGGGIVGYADGSTIEACLNQSIVKGQEQTGGIVGYVKNCNVHNNLNIGSVSSENDFDMIEGYASGSNNRSGNYYLDSKDSNNDSSYGVVQERLASGEITMALNAGIKNRLGLSQDTIVFRQNLGESIYPTLLSNARVVTETTTDYNLWQSASNLGEFTRALTNITSKIELTDDIDLTGNFYFGIYTENRPFAGEIKGNGHALKNMNYQVTKNAYNRFNDVNAALFAYAHKAKFSDFTLENFCLTQEDETLGNHDVEAILVANSYECTYDNITLRNCQILLNDDPDWLATIGGLVACSKCDKIENCTVESSCKFQSHTNTADAFLGGIAAKASGTTFNYCHNAARLEADDNRVGGICANANASKFNNCLNTGDLWAKKYAAGIVGYADDGSVVNRCVNTGTISGYKNSSYDYHAGIVGCLKGSESYVKDCWTYGNIDNPDDNSDIIVGAKEDGAQSKGFAMWHCVYNNELKTNLKDDKGKTWTLDQIDSGEYAFSNGFYQSIDNDPFATSLPVPIPAAGTVYQNTLCYGTETYSNLYHNTTTHTPVGDNGICHVCGNILELPQKVYIHDAKGLRDFSYAVNKGAKYENTTIYLNNDIDMASVDNFTPIGNSSHSFTGTFDGQGYSIKNLSIVRSDAKEGVGLFGFVGGNATIKNVRVDTTCVFRTNGNYVGAIVGCVRIEEGVSNKTVNLSNCCNEASVTGDKAVGGLFGAVETISCTLNIDHCYNAGNVRGNQYVAALCGWLINSGKTKISDSWNSGNVIGYTDRYPFVYYEDATRANLTITNSYNLSTLSGSLDNVSAEEVESGKLALLLNGGSGKSGDTAWYQNIGVDKHPFYNGRPGQYDKIVYSHDSYHCNTPAEKSTVINNLQYPIDVILHNCDDNGFCHDVANETHYEEPLLVDNTWQVKNMGNLYWVAESVNSGITQHDCVLMNDVTDNKTVIYDGALYPAVNKLRKWTPIGTFANPFRKTFSGNGHTISGLYSYSDDSYVGLFGFIEFDAIIENVGVEDSYFYADYRSVGAIVGGATHRGNSTVAFPRIRNCYSDGIVITGDSYAGGLIGKYYFRSDDNPESIIENCYTTCKVKSLSSSSPVSTVGSLIGGIGYNDNNGEAAIRNSYYLDGRITNGTAHNGTPLSEQQFASGYICYLLNDTLPDGIWGQDISQPYPVFSKEGMKHYYNAMPNKWGTICLPFSTSAPLDNYDFRFYTVTAVSDSEIVLRKCDTNLPAGTPVLVERGEFLSGIDLPRVGKDFVTSPLNDAPLDGLNLIGTFVNEDITNEKGYVIANKAAWNIQTVKGDNSVVCPPFHAYLSCSKEPVAKQLTIKIVGLNPYSVEDVKAIAELILGKSEVTVTELSHYDFDGNERIDILDQTFLVDNLNEGDSRVITPGEEPKGDSKKMITNE